jgi:hypothetical protein
VSDSRSDVAIVGVGLHSFGRFEGKSALTTKFFGMKANRYLHDYGISTDTLAKVAAKNFRNGALNPNAFRRKPISEAGILASPGAQLPTDPIHVLHSRRRRRRRCNVPRRPRTAVHQETGTGARGRDPHPPLWRLGGEHHLRAGPGGCVAYCLCLAMST